MKSDAGDDDAAAVPPDPRSPTKADQESGGPTSEVAVDGAPKNSGDEEASEEAPKLRAAASKRKARPQARPNKDYELPALAGPKIKLSNLKIGHSAHGKVTLVRDKFALVECGAEVEGLLHVQDMHGSAREATEVVTLGDIIAVVVSGVCNRRKRVSLKQSGTPAEGAGDVDAGPQKRRKRVRKSQKRARQKDAAEAAERGEAPRKKRRRKVASQQEDGDEAPVGDEAKADEEALIGEQLATAKGKAKSRPKRQADPDGDADAEDDFGDCLEGTLSDEEQKHLQRDIVSRLDETADLTMEAEDKADLAEFVVSNLKDGKKPSEVKAELADLMSNHAADFTAWLVQHVKGEWIRAARSRTGATAKAAPKRP